MVFSPRFPARVAASLIPLLAGLASAPEARAEDRSPLWMVHVSEGAAYVDSLTSIHEAFYLAAQNSLGSARSLGIPREQRFLFFGHWVGPVGFTRMAGTENADKAFRVFGDSALAGESNQCTKAGEFIAAYMPPYFAASKKVSVVFDPKAPAAKQSVRDLRDLDGDGTQDLTGPSTIEGIRAAIDQIADKAVPGDRVIFNYAGNGGPDGTLALSRGYLNAAELKGYASKLADKGVSIQFNIMSCYAGKSNQLLGGNSCATVSHKAGVAGDPASGYYYGTSGGVFIAFYDRIYMLEMRKRQSQLEAFACAMGVEPLNFPESSLDQVTEAWEQSEGLVSGLPERSKIADWNSEAPAAPEGMDARRASLRASYLKLMLGTTRECQQMRENRVQGAFNACLKTDEFWDTYRANYKGEIKPFVSLPKWIRDSRTREERGDALDRINRHLRLIDSASEKVVADFRAAFCCLATPLRGGEPPEACR